MSRYSRRPVRSKYARYGSRSARRIQPVQLLSTVASKDTVVPSPDPLIEVTDRYPSQSAGLQVRRRPHCALAASGGNVTGTGPQRSSLRRGTAAQAARRNRRAARIGWSGEGARRAARHPHATTSTGSQGLAHAFDLESAALAFDSVPRIPLRDVFQAAYVSSSIAQLAAAAAKARTGRTTMVGRRAVV